MNEAIDDIILGPFPQGMNNRQPDHRLPDGTVRNLVNVKVDNSGILSRRDGIELVYSGLGCRDGFSCSLGTFFRQGASLMRLLDDDTSEELFTGVVGDQCAFEYHNDILYFSDGVITKKIFPDFSFTNWGMEVPGTPAVYSTSGTYGAGTYLAAITFVDVDGNESGASDFVSVSLDSPGALVFTNIPTTTDSQVTGVRLYLSTPNGDVLYQIAEVSPGTASYTQSLGTYDDNKVLETEFIIPPPAGRIIRGYNGVIYIADALGNVWHTNPMSYDQVHMTENFLQFPKVVDVMEPVIDGIFFAHGNVTDFYAGQGPDSFSPRQVLDYGAVFGTGREYNDTTRAWYSTKGAVLGGSGGQVKNLQEDNVAADTADSGASLVREEDGIRQFITSLTNPTTSTLAAKDFIDAEIIRKG